MRNAKKSTPFEKLSAKEQKLLVAHFVNEGFAANAATARKDCLELGKADCAAHVSAAVNGYMY